MRRPDAPWTRLAAEALWRVSAAYHDPHTADHHLALLREHADRMRRVLEDERRRRPAG